MKKNIKQLVDLSKTGGKLDWKKIKKIAVRLSRSELKNYLLLLKIAREKEKMLVETPLGSMWTKNNLAAFFKKNFKDREIIFAQNKELLGGIRVTFDNNVFDMSINGLLKRLESTL